MTGFGRSSAECDGVTATWELRSVNGKGLDMRFRMPGSLDAAERAMREHARKALHRGNVQIALTIERDEREPVPEIDHETLDRLVAAARDASERHGLAMPDAGTFIAMKGVMRMPEAEEDVRPANAAGAAAAHAVFALVEDREREGARLAAIVAKQIDAIERLVQAADADGSRRPDAIAERLAVQVTALADAPEIDRERLHAEAAMLAVRADLAEELDRLRSHVAAARELLVAGGPVGRRFEFLAQEFGREANTLCAKSNAASLTAIGLELKVVVDQLREQVANVE